MTASLLMSTDEVPPRERAPVWREWVWRHFGGLDSDLCGDSDFDGHIAASHAGDVILTRLEANLQLVRLSLMELAGQDTPLTQREALKDRIRRYVAQHLHDPALSIDGIAQALRCSKRLAHTGGSPSEFRRHAARRPPRA